MIDFRVGMKVGKASSRSTRIGRPANKRLFRGRFLVDHHAGASGGADGLHPLNRRHHLVAGVPPHLDLCVCVREFPPSVFDTLYFPCRPRKDAVYTIREVAVHQDDGYLGLRFVELKNPVLQFSDGLTEAAFDHRAFRPLQERDEDIAIFRKLIEPAELQKFVEPADPKREPVDA